MRIRWSDEARLHLTEIVRYVAARRPDAARKLRDALHGAVQELNTHPLIGRVVPELDIANIREVVRGNYRIMYVLRSREVFIVAVVHGRQVAGPAEE